jgi:hypothetical protein
MLGEVTVNISTLSEIEIVLPDWIVYMMISPWFFFFSYRCSIGDFGWCDRKFAGSMTGESGIVTEPWPSNIIRSNSTPHVYRILHAVVRNIHMYVIIMSQTTIILAT